MDSGTLFLTTAAAGLTTCMTIVMAVRARYRAKAAEADAAQTARAMDGADESLRMAPVGDNRWGLFASAMRPGTFDEISALRVRLAQAGMRSIDAVDLFSVVRFISLLVGLLAFFLMIVGGLGAYAMIFGSCVLGIAFIGPQFWLDGRIKERQRRLQRSLPPTLDLLLTCVEAGLGLEQALARVADETGYSDPEMAEEIRVVVGEINAGLTTSAAFRKLSERVTSDEVRNLSNVIVQSSSLGASLGRTLREYAVSARRKRELGLEERAGKVTAGLTLPLTLCLLPSSMLAMLGPAIVMIVRSLGGDG